MLPANFQFSDIQELGQLAGWDVDFKALKAGGSPSVDARIHQGRNLAAMKLEFARAYRQRAKAPPGMVTLGLPISGVRYWFGRPYRPMSVLPFNHESGIDSVTIPGQRGYTISVASDFLTNLADAYQLPFGNILDTPRPDSVIADSVAAEALRQSLEALDSANGSLIPELEEELAVLFLLTASPESNPADRSTPAARACALAKALEYMATYGRNAPTVGDICAATGVASRTLERAFKERFGIGPKAYLIRRRLHAVRNELLRRADGASVADIANEWGFWHLGQFAQDYRRRFGELPSETLRTATSRQN